MKRAKGEKDKRKKEKGKRKKEKEKGKGQRANRLNPALHAAFMALLWSKPRDEPRH
jgi:hypothetical protein